MVSLTFGDAPTADFVPSDFRNIREEESRREAKVLGVSQDCLHFLGHKVFAINKERAVQEVMSILRKVKPDICYIPSPEGNHPDYAATYEVATIALSFSGGKWFKSANNNQDSWTVPTVLIYEVSVPLRSPSYYEVISEYVEQKKRAQASRSVLFLVDSVTQRLSDLATWQVIVSATSSRPATPAG